MSWDRTCCMSTTSSSIDSGASSAFSPSSLIRDYDVALPSSSSSSSSSSSASSTTSSNFFYAPSDYIDETNPITRSTTNAFHSPLIQQYQIHASSNYSTRAQTTETCFCNPLNNNNEIQSGFVYEQYLTTFKSEQSEFIPYLFENVGYPQPCSPPSPSNDSITYFQLDQVHQNMNSAMKAPKRTHSQLLSRTIQPIIYHHLSSIEPASSNGQQQLPIVQRFYYDSTMSTTTMTGTTPIPTIAMNNENLSVPYARLDSSLFGIYDICQEKTVVGRKNMRRPIDVNIGSTSVVSRIHFEILLINGNEFHLKCLSKNGIFINNNFAPMSTSSILPKQCTLRFPSTDLCISFCSLLTSNNHRSSTDSCQQGCLSSSINMSEVCPRSLSPISCQQQVIVVNSNATSLSTEDKMQSTTSKHCDDTSVSMDSGIQPLSITLKEENVENGKNTSIVCQANNELHGPEFEHSSSKNSAKPPYSYAQLIVQAICSSPSRQMTLSQIYNFISGQYPYYETNQRGWQNSIRHNLSLNRYFIRSARRENDCGKGSFWRLDKKCEDKLIDHAFRHRKQRSSSMTNSTMNENRNEFDELVEMSSNDPTEFLLTDLHISNPSTPVSPMISPSSTRSNDEFKRKLDEDDDNDNDDDDQHVDELLKFMVDSICSQRSSKRWKIAV